MSWRLRGGYRLRKSRQDGSLRRLDFSRTEICFPGSIKFVQFICVWELFWSKSRVSLDQIDWYLLRCLTHDSGEVLTHCNIFWRTGFRTTHIYKLWHTLFETILLFSKFTCVRTKSTFFGLSYFVTIWICLRYFVLIIQLHTTWDEAIDAFHFLKKQNIFKSVEAFRFVLDFSRPLGSKMVTLIVMVWNFWFQR